MSTNCGIAVKTTEGYKTIYCHWDGYPRYMLAMLQDYYNSEELADELVSHGDASCICKKLEPTTFMHSFADPEKDVCVFYYRDRGEDWEDVAPAYHTKASVLHSRFDYVYIWENDCWTVYRHGRKVG